MLHWIQAALAAAAVAGIAWRAHTLKGSGAIGATIIGTLVFGFGGLAAAAMLVFFFISSSALSRLNRGERRSRRGFSQVFANGSIAAAAAASMGVLPGASAAYLGALAAATADTWATAIGVRFGGTPRSILSFKHTAPGASGAVTCLGTIASALGALSVGLAGQLLLRLPLCGWVAVTVAGFFASLLDSLLGDSLQAVYRCRECGERPEVARHDGCPARAERQAGIPGLDNDVVNWIATLAGAGGAWLLLRLC